MGSEAAQEQKKVSFSGNVPYYRQRRPSLQVSLMKPVARIVTLFLALVALAQFLRLVLQVEVVAGGLRIPLWLSALACVVTGGLAILLWRESQR